MLCVVLSGVEAITDGPILLGTLTPEARTDLYGSLAATAGALLGFIVASLSILISLPSSDTVKQVRARKAWPLLLKALLASAALLAGLLVTASAALAIDRAKTPCVAVELVVEGVTLAAAIQLAVAGAAFAIVVLRIRV